jgi:putative transposase
MNCALDECRWLWNYFLEQRKNAYENDQIRISHYQQNNQLKSLKIERPSLKNVFSQVLQNVTERLELAFRAFYRRCKNGEAPGYPRFRGKDRYDSFCYPQMGFRIHSDRIYLSKIGHVSIVLHRPIHGNIKRCLVKRSPTGKWFVTLSVESNDESPIIPLNKIIGLDVGIKSFVTFSDGQKVDNPKFFKQDRKALKKAQQLHQLNKTKKTKKVISRIHERIRNRRENFSHQLSRQVINNNDIICVEDLSINRMKESSFKVLNREISDAAWTSFINKLTYKAEWAGKLVVKVNPAYTSQDCSHCGYRVEKKLSTRIHECPSCGLVLDRDINAALNILALGTQSLTLSRSPCL